MKSILAVLLLSALAANAQDCINNADSAGNVCTAFTLGPPTANCIPVLTQDGQPVPQFSGAVCPGGFFGGTAKPITVPYNSLDPGVSPAPYLHSPGPFLQTELHPSEPTPP